MHFRIIGIACLTFLTTSRALSEFRLQADSDITIREQGDFDSAAGWSSELLQRNLCQLLNKDHLIGTGAPVEFILSAEAPRWPQLAEDARQRITQVDAYTITIRSRPSPRITIAGKTPVATGFGILAK